MHKETQCNVSGHDQTVFMDKGETSAASTLFPLAGHHNEDEDEEKKSKDAWMQCTSFPLEKVMPKKAPDAAALDDVRQARAAAFLSSDSDEHISESFSNGSQEGHHGHRFSKDKSSKKRKRRKKEMGRRPRKKVKSDLDKILEMEKRPVSKSLGGHSVQELQGWLSKEAQRHSRADGFILDKKGCYENVLYERLYRLEIPAYYRNGHIGNKLRDSLAAQLEKQRYYSAKSMARERSRKLKRFRIQTLGNNTQSTRLSLPAPAMLPLTAEETSLGESEEQYVMRKTKEFNIATRERPFELNLWVQFSQFQDDAARLLKQKGSERSTAERKIAILEKGLSYHPGAEELVLLLLECVELIEDADSVRIRWERVLDNSPGSSRLWAAYIQWRKSHFSTFSISSIDSLYAQALQSLSVERARQSRLGVGGKKLTDIEEGLAWLALSSVQFDLQSGFVEIGVAKIQCMIEWHFFGPEVHENAFLGVHLHTLFQKFWDSEQPRIGEHGGHGWGCWARKDSSFDQNVEDGGNIQDTVDDEEGDTAEDKGWTGWVAMSHDNEPLEEELRSTSERSYSHSDPDSGSSDLDEDGVLEEDEKELMEKLGLKLEDDLAKLEQQKDIPQDVLHDWIVKEKDRDVSQWSPNSQINSNSDGVEFEDIQEWIFELDSPRIKASLVLGCLECLGVNVDAEICSNDAVLSRVRENGIMLPGMLTETIFHEETEHSSVNEGVHGISLLKEVICSPWFVLSSGRAQFVSQILAKLKSVFQDSVTLCSGWIQTELSAAKNANKKASTQDVCRTLLESYKDHIPLWLAYAQLEAKQGNYKAARKVLDTCYSFLPALGSDAQSHKPILALCYADMEMERGAADSKERALHILFHLALDGIYKPMKKGMFDPRSPDEIVKAKRRFQMMITEAVAWNDGVLDPCRLAWVMAGALFEEMLSPDEESGVLMVVNILRNVIESTEESVRAKSLCHELLQARLCKIMVTASQRHAFLQGASPKEARHSLLCALQIYNKSSVLHRLMHQFETDSYATARLSRFVLSQCDNHPSTLNYLLAIAVESQKATRRLNLSNIIERALSISSISQRPLIWIVYLLLEIQRGAKLSGKRVMLRGVRSCPWTKRLWMSGLQGLTGVLGDREVGDFIEVMKNKGVKLRTDVYEVLLDRLELTS